MVLALDLFRSVREPGHECAFFVLLAFLGSFAFIPHLGATHAQPPGPVVAGQRSVR